MDTIKELEVVAWRIGFPNGAGYKVYEQPQPWAYKRYGTPPFVTYEVQELIRKSDADARDAMRMERIKELEAQYQRDVYGLNNEGDPIGGDPAGGYANDNARLRAELAALKVQEPVAWVGVLEDNATLLVSEPRLWKAIPLYAAPVAKQEVVKGLAEALAELISVDEDAVDAWLGGL